MADPMAHVRFSPSQVQWSDLINWKAMFALAVHYRNGLASLDPTECSVPLLFATVSAAAGGAYLAERLRLRRANNPGPPSGVAAADATAADATAASPTAASSTAAAATADAAGCCGTPNTTFRFSKWFIGLVLGFAVAGWVAELGMFAGRFESAASPIACDLWADDPEAFERCTNETREFATLERNWSPMDAGRNYSEPRPDHRALMPALVCIQALTSHAFEHDHLSRCMTFLQNGGQLPDGGVVNAKSLTNDRDFDAPYMVVAMESLRRTRLKVARNVLLHLVASGQHPDTLHTNTETMDPILASVMQEHPLDLYLIQVLAAPHKLRQGLTHSCIDPYMLPQYITPAEPELDGDGNPVPAETRNSPQAGLSHLHFALTDTTATVRRISRCLLHHDVPEHLHEPLLANDTLLLSYAQTIECFEPLPKMDSQSSSGESVDDLGFIIRALNNLDGTLPQKDSVMAYFRACLSRHYPSAAGIRQRFLSIHTVTGFSDVIAAAKITLLEAASNENESSLFSMVEAELPAPVSGFSPIMIAAQRGWALSFKALVEGYIRALNDLGFAPQEGATMPMQACNILTYTEFRYDRSALHLAGLLHGQHSVIWKLMVEMLQLCTGVSTDDEDKTQQLLQTFAAVPDKFGQTAWDYARAHGPAHVEENGASGGIPLLELPGLCATEAACQELETFRSEQMMAPSPVPAADIQSHESENSWAVEDDPYNVALLAVPVSRQTVLRIPYTRFSAETWQLQMASAKPRIFETMGSSPLRTVLGSAFLPQSLLQVGGNVHVDALSWRSHRLQLVPEGLRVYQRSGLGNLRLRSQDADAPLSELLPTLQAKFGSAEYKPLAVESRELWRTIVQAFQDTGQNDANDAPAFSPSLLHDFFQTVPGVSSMETGAVRLGNFQSGSTATWGDATSVDFLAHGQRRWMIWAPKYAFEVDVPDDVSAWSSFNALRELFNERHQPYYEFVQNIGDAVSIPPRWSSVFINLQPSASLVVRFRFHPNQPRASWSGFGLEFDGDVFEGAGGESESYDPRFDGRGTLVRKRYFHTHAALAQFTTQGHASNRAKTPAQTIKVIGTGFGRTGTSTMKTALENLGYNGVYHMTKVTGATSHAWAADIPNPPLSNILANYEAGVDYPFCLYYKHLMDLFPAARVILTRRENPIKWWTSTVGAIYKVPVPFVPLMSRALGITEEHMTFMKRWERTILWDGLFQGRVLDQEFALQVYEKHTAEVLEYASSQGRPVYIHTVTDGWEKLCEFLGIAVPDQPYPRSNSRTTRSRTVTHIDMLTHTFIVVPSMVLVLVAATGYASRWTTRVGLLATAVSILFLAVKFVLFNTVAAYRISNNEAS
eukprot:INCI3620.1.p1 GENE.INCI3620.1~~INCI3620.1.p1  ORF type:complete len:1345 (+),score=155.30 INCI3620.1:181-4215(+)